MIPVVMMIKYVKRNVRILGHELLINLAKEKSGGTFNSSKFCISNTKNGSCYQRCCRFGSEKYTSRISCSSSNDFNDHLEVPAPPSKDIWSLDEVPDSNVKVPDEVDQRPQPE